MKGRLIVNTIALNLEESLDFYRNLGFEIIELGEEHYAVDQSVVIRINDNTSDRKGLSLIKEDWKDEVDYLEKSVPVLNFGDRKLLSDSSGNHVYLENGFLNFPTISNNSILGNYAGISIEVIEFDRCVQVWTSIGFAIDSGGCDQGWVSLTNDQFGTVSIMKANSCPHLFSNPGLTYFNGSNNLKIIEAVRRSGVSIAEEVTVFNSDGNVDNIILQDPGGLTFFLFND